MIRTLEATIDKDGVSTCRNQYSFLKRGARSSPSLKKLRASPQLHNSAKKHLRKDWNRPEEDEAWTHLDPAQ